MSQFVAKLSGNPINISLILSKMDEGGAGRLYPLHCLDGYHFEDALVTCGLSESNQITILDVIKSNVRGNL